MESKPWYASKTIWVNLVALGATLGTAAGLDLGLDVATQATLVAGIMAIINVGLRMVSGRSISGGGRRGIRTALILGVGLPLIGVSLQACSGSADLLRQAQPIIREKVAETGSQDNTVFTMQALGCYERLQDYRLDRTVRVMRLPEDSTALTAPDADLLAGYQGCVAAMQTTRNQGQPAVVQQFFQ